MHRKNIITLDSTWNSRVIAQVNVFRPSTINLGYPPTFCVTLVGYELHKVLLQHLPSSDVCGSVCENTTQADKNTLEQ